MTRTILLCLLCLLTTSGSAHAFCANLFRLPLRLETLSSKQTRHLVGVLVEKSGGDQKLILTSSLKGHDPIFDSTFYPLLEGAQKVLWMGELAVQGGAENEKGILVTESITTSNTYSFFVRHGVPIRGSNLERWLEKQKEQNVEVELENSAEAIEQFLVAREFSKKGVHRKHSEPFEHLAPDISFDFRYSRHTMETFFETFGRLEREASSSGGKVRLSAISSGVGLRSFSTIVQFLRTMVLEIERTKSAEAVRFRNISEPYSLLRELEEGHGITLEEVSKTIVDVGIAFDVYASLQFETMVIE